MRSNAISNTKNPIRNGVDTATLFAILNAVKGDTDLAKFQFRATNCWLHGTHNQSTIHGFRGARRELTHRELFTLVRWTPTTDLRTQYALRMTNYLRRRTADAG